LWDKDSQRRNISHYKDTPEHKKESARMVFEMTKKMMLFCIENWSDMIFDGIIYQEAVMRDMIDFVKNHWWDLVHVHLTASKEIWEERIEKRGISWSLTIEKARFFYENMTKIPKELFSVEIDTSNKDEATVCKEIENFLA